MALSTSDIKLPSSNKAPIKFTSSPEPKIETKIYILRVRIFDLFEAPQRDHNYIIVKLGHYKLKTTKLKVHNGRSRLHTQLEDLNVEFPKDTE
jgi:hypothetical protein